MVFVFCLVPDIGEYKSNNHISLAHFSFENFVTNYLTMLYPITSHNTKNCCPTLYLHYNV